MDNLSKLETLHTANLLNVDLHIVVILALNLWEFMFTAEQTENRVSMLGEQLKSRERKEEMAQELSCACPSAGGDRSWARGSPGDSTARQGQGHTKQLLRAICQGLGPLWPPSHSSRQPQHSVSLTSLQYSNATRFSQQTPFTSGKSLSLHYLVNPPQFHLNVFEFAHLIKTITTLKLIPLSNI